MKDSPEAKLASSADDVYCQSSLNEQENHRNGGKTVVCVWRSVTIPDLATDVMKYGHHVAPNV